jgi:hypothetical protein
VIHSLKTYSPTFLEGRLEVEISMTWMWGAAYAAARNRLEQVRDFQRDPKGKLLNAYARGRKKRREWERQRRRE